MLAFSPVTIFVACIVLFSRWRVGEKRVDDEAIKRTPDESPPLLRTVGVVSINNGRTCAKAEHVVPLVKKECSSL